MIVWFTGQPGSGKTTLARRLLDDAAVDFVVDGDDLRTLMPNPGYDEAGRRQNIDRAQTLAAWGHHTGYRVAVALVAPYRDQREQFKAHYPVHEIFCRYDRNVEQRGREQFWVDDYEPPVGGQWLQLDTDQITIDRSIAAVMQFIKRKGSDISAAPLAR